MDSYEGSKLPGDFSRESNENTSPLHTRTHTQALTRSVSLTHTRKHRQDAPQIRQACGTQSKGRRWLVAGSGVWDACVWRGGYA